MRGWITKHPLEREFGAIHVHVIHVILYIIIIFILYVMAILDQGYKHK